MWYVVELTFEGATDPERVHEILARANTYAIVDRVETEPGGDGHRFIARIDAPSPEAALGSVLTVLAQASDDDELVRASAARQISIRAEPAGE